MFMQYVPIWYILLVYCYFIYFLFLHLSAFSWWKVKETKAALIFLNKEECLIYKKNKNCVKLSRNIEEIINLVIT